MGPASAPQTPQYACWASAVESVPPARPAMAAASAPLTLMCARAVSARWVGAIWVECPHAYT